MTRAEFVRKHAGLAPAKILEKARAAGFGLTLQNIYATRHADKRAEPMMRATMARAVRAMIDPVGYAYDVGRMSSPEYRFAELACEIGFVRAGRLLADVRTRALA